MHDPADLSHAELVAEVRQLRALVASYRATSAKQDVGTTSPPLDEAEAQGGLGAELAQELALQEGTLSAFRHQVRTVLNSTLGAIEALLEGIYGPLNERQQHALGRAEQGVHRLAALLL